MQSFIMRIPLFVRLISVVFIVLFFVPIVNSFGVSISCLNLLVGIKAMGITVYPGSFSVIFVLITPLAILAISFLKLPQKQLVTIGFTIIGFIVSGRLWKAVDYAVSSTSWVVLLYILGYIALLVMNVLLLLRANVSKLSAARESIKSVVTSENVQRGLSNAKQAATTLADKAKTTISDISNTDAKKATSIADQLKTYKELLDKGIITQEEFDKKKSEILSESQR